jgi:2-polyprenyl-3-methyl-5-hydroxy-6-metoxy-1,4-benzoquinol methylase
MKILLVSHSTAMGGGEKALINLFNQLREGNEIEVVFPNQQGDLIDYFLSQGVTCNSINIPVALPDFTSYLSHLSEINFDEVVNSLKGKKFQLVISNTIAAPHGGIIANRLNIAHITYVHEYMDGDEDLTVIGMSNKNYINLIEKQSDHVICCSKFVKNSLNRKTASSVLYPHDFSKNIISNKYLLNKDEFNILVIGVKSVRKNTHFAVTVSKALRLRGHNVQIHIIGNDSTGTNKLHTQISNRNEQNIFLHPQTQDPYNYLELGNCITLVCAKVEAFGLTISESLQRETPVVSSRSGGPEELLDANYLYEIDNIDQCVRALEKIIFNYQDEVKKAGKKYLKLQQYNYLKLNGVTLDTTIVNTVNKFKSKVNLPLELHVAAIKNVVNNRITKEQLINNISKINQESFGLNNDLDSLVEIEDEYPGTSVLQDIRKFDAVPYGASKNMDSLYREGLGLAVELASTFNDKARIKMASIIIGKLLEISNYSSNLEVLSIGDGLGVDAIRFASCGFSVDYIDFDNSNMAKIAELNFMTAKSKDEKLDIRVLKKPNKKYESVICLEVIEHVEDVFGFITMLKDLVSDGGYLFISECFDGIRDRWPTHLNGNEKYSNLLPLMLAPYFKLVDFNKEPYCKPYIFQRKSTDLVTPKEIFELINDKWLSLGIISSKTSIGI